VTTRWFALALLAAALTAHAQDDCPHAGDSSQATLLGTWHAEFDNGQQAATLVLQKDPEFDETVIGTVERDGQRRQVAGDVDEADVTLEESADGVHIAATWLGEVVEGSCGKEIRGTWKAEGAKEGFGFVLRKAP
jgi:hypothetical protein